MIILTKLILAHLVGDFLLQPKSWVVHKEQYKLKSFKLYLHALVHAVVIMVLIGQWEFIIPGMFIAIAHLIIDALKILLQREKTKRIWFIIDQFLHLLIIVLVWIYSQNPEINVEWLQQNQVWMTITAVIFLTKPSSVAIKFIISQWDLNPHIQSLENAGHIIGILERLFVFVFVLVGSWEAVGFLIAAKSVFRFGDLKDSQEVKLTEYVLIGTLLSFGLGILTALFVR